MNLRARSCILPILLVLLAFPSGAQTTVSSLGEPYVVDQWTVNNGLPQNTIASIVQTADGFLWLGTNGGLVRFDGVRFHTFDRLSSQDGRAHRVTTLVEGLDSSLWVGTEDGQLFRHRAGNFAPMIRREHDAPQWPILSMAMDSSGLVWLGRARLGLARVMATLDRGDTVVQASLQPEWPQPVVTVVR
ncbi:MAG: two-component regulator propeller domain-containing protein, partial [Bacteroidota bacterium]